MRETGRDERDKNGREKVSINERKRERRPFHPKAHSII